MRKQPQNPKPRNLLHDHPLLQKGGAHGKTRKASRRVAKMELRREWCPQSAVVESVVPALLPACVCP